MDLKHKISRAGWLALLVPVLGLAEPGVSSVPITLLWTLALVLSAAAAWLVGKLIAKMTGIGDPRYRWGVTIILFLVFAIFLAPFFVVLGAIFITGRTM
jgi:hypothetical protein